MRTVFFLVLLLCGMAQAENPKFKFWNTPRRGANFFNHEETRDRFHTAHAMGARVVRLVFNKWESSAPGAQEGDFLIGPKDQDFQTLIPGDLKKIKEALDWAEAEGLKVVVSNLSLPGLRWVQHNGNRPDLRLWTDFRYHEQAAQFWIQLATALRDHPAVVGYNLLNEPHPEKVRPQFQDWFTGDYEAWEKSVRGTPRDLNLFHERIAKAIRTVDTKTPLVLDSGFYATAFAFKILRPLADPNTLYSFHMYEPYSITNYNNHGQYRYPGRAPIGEAEPPPSVDWNRETLSTLLQPVRDWQKRYGIPSRQIFASEFGIFRVNEGAVDYLRDVVALLEAEKWHWAFYSYREDTWSGMDYEVGTEPHEPGALYPLRTRQKLYKANPLCDVLIQAMRTL